MKAFDNPRWSALRLLACAVAILSVALGAAPAVAGEEEDDERHVVRKVIVRCEGENCEESSDEYEVDLESLHDAHGFAWISGEGPGRMEIHTAIGGGYLGVLLAELTPELRTHFGVDESAGVMISKVVDDSPAARAGLQVGDIVTAVDREPVETGHALGRAIRKKEEGDAVLLEVWREGAVMNVTATVDERRPMGQNMNWKFVLDCDEDDEENCSIARRHMRRLHHGPHADACEGGGPCDVRVMCESEDRADCECTVNGEPTDCATLPGFDD